MGEALNEHFIVPPVLGRWFAVIFSESAAFHSRFGLIDQYLAVVNDDRIAIFQVTVRLSIDN